VNHVVAIVALDVVRPPSPRHRRSGKPRQDHKRKGERPAWSETGKALHRPTFMPGIRVDSDRCSEGDYQSDDGCDGCDEVMHGVSSEP
jgi:hypothetical protein